MLRVPVNQALPGMQLSLPVLHPQRGTVLLCEGYVLDERVTRRLAELQVHCVWVEYPNTEQIRQYVSPAVAAQQTQLVGRVADMLEVVHRDGYAALDFADYRRTIQGLLESLVMEPAAAAYIVELGGAAESELRHASEVCFLSILLGLKLQGYLIQQRKRLRPKDARDVVSLGLGAMLHDVGKLALEPQVRDRYELTRDESDPLWRHHPALGHKMLSGTISPAAAGVVLHHHQHYDGSGFPAPRMRSGRARSLAGETIHVFARIVCVANHFDRLRRLPGGIIEPRVRILRNMLAGPMTARFDPVVLASLPMVVPAYPPGSMATLSSGERVVVVQWHAEAPCQPTVQLLPRNLAEGQPEPGEAVRYDLRERPDLLIVEHDGHHVMNDNFRLVKPNTAQSQDAA